MSVREFADRGRRERSIRRTKEAVLRLSEHAARELAGGTETERDPYGWLARLGRYAWTIHLQQTDGEFDRHWPFTEQFNANGIIDPERVVELVGGLPQDEVELMLEPVHAFEAPHVQVVRDLRESVEFWRPSVRRLGIRLRAATGR